MLQNTTDITAAGTTTSNVDDGLGQRQTALVQVTLSAVPAGGAPTLDVYLQTSVDGSTWRDVAHTQFTTSTLTRFFSVSGQQSAGAAPLAASDGALAGETVSQGPYADRLRLKFVAAAGGSNLGSGGKYTVFAQGVYK